MDYYWLGLLIYLVARGIIATWEVVSEYCMKFLVRRAKSAGFLRPTLRYALTLPFAIVAQFLAPTCIGFIFLGLILEYCIRH